MSNMYDPTIVKAVKTHFPELLEFFGPCGWLWVKAQIWQESRFDPKAKSPAGAMGLMQIMPATAAQLGLTDPYSPQQSIHGGVRYLAEQFRKLAEINPYGSRLRFALASYNGGRGYINMALALARQGEGLPFGYQGWVKAGSPRGRWQWWQHTNRFLAEPECLVRGRRPDWQQMTHYVQVIEEQVLEYLRGCIRE